MKPEIIYPQYSSGALVRDIWRLIGPYKTRFIVASLLRLSSDVAWLYPTYAMAAIVDFFATYTTGASLHFVWVTLAIWIIASLYHYLSHEVAKYMGFQVSEKVSLDAQLKTTQHLFLLDLAWHEKENSGNKLKRIQRGGEGLKNVIRMWFVNLIEIAVNLVGMIFILAAFDLKISMEMLVFVVTFFIISFSLTKKAAQAAHRVNVDEEVLTGLSFEAINNIRSVKVLSMGETLMNRFNVLVDALFEKIRHRILRFRSREAILNLWAQCFRLGTIIFIIVGITNGRYEVGFLVLFHGYFVKIWESIRELSEVTNDFIISKYGIARMMDILREPIRIENEVGKSDMDEEWDAIRLHDVSFSYGHQQVLQNISFDIKRGEKVGIVGLSGAGKSTLFKLLLKEHETYTGDIYVGTRPLREIKKSSYFQHVAVVLQDTEVFNFTLRDNITIAGSGTEIDEKGLKKALAVAHVDDFTHKLPDGLETYIGEKGIKLSGGERQRVGIARAVYKNPQILFLDEATSHLDLESEEKIRDSLHQFFQNVTAVVIAHRLSTIREMDRIYVIEDGRIIESGNFDELQAKQGRFHELWEKQKF